MTWYQNRLRPEHSRDLWAGFESVSFRSVPFPVSIPVIITFRTDNGCAIRDIIHVIQSATCATIDSRGLSTIYGATKFDILWYVGSWVAAYLSIRLVRGCSSRVIDRLLEWIFSSSKGKSGLATRDYQAYAFRCCVCRLLLLYCF